MKAFDPKGEYTPEEVKAALAGVNGTRQLSFRYERLDKNNKFIENIDYVQSCSIENNSLADIKRTAKFDILDTGRMNYLSDRIKPYVRLSMPEELSYKEEVIRSSPSVWWKMDDSFPSIPAVVETYAPSDNTYSTRETALVLSETGNRRALAHLATGSATLRSDLWVSVTVTTTGAIDFMLEAVDQPITASVYFANTSTSTLTLITTQSLSTWTRYNQKIPFPSNGIYYVKLSATSSTADLYWADVTMTRTARLEDSSGNGVYATTGMFTGQPSVLPDGGKSIACASDGSDSPAVRWGATDVKLPLTGGFSLNFWIKVPSNTGGRIQSSWTSTSGMKMTSSIDIRTSGNNYYSLSITDYGVSNFAGSLSIPANRFGAGGHMLSLVTDPKANSMSLYIDGSYVGDLSDYRGYSVADTKNSLTGTSISYMDYWIQAPNGVTVNIDDFMMYGRALKAPEISTIYSTGLAYKSRRSGYVEWPQGVFLLSSPSRKMADGNTITRKVDGYDQLIALKEDSYDYRYSVPAGVKYTDAIAKILNVRPDGAASIPFTDPAWISFGGVNITSPTSLVLTDSDINGLPGLGTDAAVTSLGGANLSAKVTVAGTNAEMNFSVQTIKNISNNLMWIVDSTNLMVIHSQTGSNAGGVSWSKTLYSVPYNATTHAYWRLRESGGTMYWETSSNGTTWNLNYSMATPYDPYTPMNVMFVAGMNGAATGTVNIDNMSLTYGNSQPVSLELNSATLPTTMEWGTGTSKLKIINDLLAAINYTSATYNEHGIFTAGKYISPQNRASSFTYATDSQSVLTGDVDQTMDLFGVPNKWIVVVSEPDRAPLTGTYTNANPNSPTSTVSRGRTIVDFRTEQNAPDQITLDALASRLAFEASQVYEVIEFNTALMPIHQNADVYNLIIDGLVVNSKYAEHSWKMDLSTGSTMSHKVRKVVTV